MTDETADVRAWLPTLAERWRDGAWSDAEFGAIYFLLSQRAQHGPRFASRTDRRAPRLEGDRWLHELVDDPRPTSTLLELVARYQFLHVTSSVNHALLRWLRGEWSIALDERIPSPYEVLAQQASGVRPATVVCDYPRLLEPVLGKRDGLHFLVHDLEHAYKFFHDPESHGLQRRLFVALRALVEAGGFAPYLEDATFRDQFEYLISDMNTHPAHGLHYLRATLIEHILRVARRGAGDPLPEDDRVALDVLLAGLCETCGLRPDEVFRATQPRHTAAAEPA